MILASVEVTLACRRREESNSSLEVNRRTTGWSGVCVCVCVCVLVYVHVCVCACTYLFFSFFFKRIAVECCRRMIRLGAHQGCS